MEPTEKIRIIVVGDSGVLYTHTRLQKPYFIEFIDISGSSTHTSSRNMFYHQVNGIILVHDVSNRKSYYNLWRWIAEVLHSEAYKDNEKSWAGSAIGNKKNEYDFELQIGEQFASVPILVVGTKADLVKQELTGRQRRYSIVDEYGGECVNVCTLAPSHFFHASLASDKFDAFFDKVIDKKYHFVSDHSISPSLATLNPYNSPPLTSREEARRRGLNIGAGGTVGGGVPGTPVFGSMSGGGNGGGMGSVVRLEKDLGSPKKNSWGNALSPKQIRNAGLYASTLTEDPLPLRPMSSPSPSPATLRPQYATPYNHYPQSPYAHPNQPLRSESMSLRTSSSASSLRQLYNNNTNQRRGSTVAEVAIHPLGSNGGNRPGTYWVGAGNGNGGNGGGR
ncbi:9402_t:CDS:2 [Paraglomus brasilianum]|uniref:9402_t:CDS:1 n=1 Tax=Paraglomus brasilianum TaxID=144538 RepID=A0A9N9AW43_9GLOM|nr:9402_t:CDS:2 [Paraglomus brasilianum]